MSEPTNGGCDAACRAVPLSELLAGSHMEIQGLDGLTRSLEELQRAFEKLNGDIANVSFDPHDPESIERAIEQLCTAVDKKVSGHAHSQAVMSIAGKFKEAGRNAILERAAAARLSGVEEP